MNELGTTERIVLTAMGGLIVLAMVIVAVVLHRHAAPSDCEFRNKIEAHEVENALRERLAEGRFPPWDDWHFHLGRRSAQMTLDYADGSVRIDRTYDAFCFEHVTVEVDPTTGAWAKDLPWESLIRSVPLETVPDGKPSNLLWTAFSLVLLLAVGFLPRRFAAPIGLFGVGLLALAVTWPVLPLPFTTCAEVDRFLMARENLFGDWNHTFLPYLFNRPVALFTAEPFALRLVPLLFIVAETLLLMVNVLRTEKPLYAVLAGLWFICEIPRRRGLLDLGDWDMAGTFLLAWLWMIQGLDSKTPRSWRKESLFLSLLLFGAFSSYLMVIPLVGLALVLLELRSHPRLAWGAVVVLALASLTTLSVFHQGMGGHGHAETNLAGFILDMLRQMPLARTPWMALPVAFGLAWAVYRWREPWVRFSLFALVSVPVAVLLAWRLSTVNGGYYVGLVTPLLVFVTVMGTARVFHHAFSRLSPIFARYPVALPGGETTAQTLAVFLLGMATIFPATGTQEITVNGMNRIARLADETRTNDLPIRTNDAGLGKLLLHQRLLQAERRHETAARTEDLSNRVVLIGQEQHPTAQTRLLDESGALKEHYLVLRGYDVGANEAFRNELLRHGIRCIAFAEEEPTHDAIQVYRCRREAGD